MTYGTYLHGENICYTRVQLSVGDSKSIDNMTVTNQMLAQPELESEATTTWILTRTLYILYMYVMLRVRGCARGRVWNELWGFASSIQNDVKDPWFRSSLSIKKLVIKRRLLYFVTNVNFILVLCKVFIRLNNTINCKS